MTEDALDSNPDTQYPKSTDSAQKSSPGNLTIGPDVTDIIIDLATPRCINLIGVDPRGVQRQYTLRVSQKGGLIIL